MGLPWADPVSGSVGSYIIETGSVKSPLSASHSNWLRDGHETQVWPNRTQKSAPASFSIIVDYLAVYSLEQPAVNMATIQRFPGCKTNTKESTVIRLR